MSNTKDVDANHDETVPTLNYTEHHTHKLIFAAISTLIPKSNLINVQNKFMVVKQMAFLPRKISSLSVKDEIAFHTFVALNLVDEGKNSTSATHNCNNTTLIHQS
uniref:Uncharacterized protein n=1 Tax=Noccaea caerulescens TaxID=107243 RepID=A0A1J3HFS5_NOCCA